MTKKIRVRMINGERWYSAIDLGGSVVCHPDFFGLATAPQQWIRHHITSDKRRLIRKGECQRPTTYLHESVCSRWLDYVEQRHRTTHIRMTQSVACQARAAGVAMNKVVA